MFLSRMGLLLKHLNSLPYTGSSSRAQWKIESVKGKKM